MSDPNLSSALHTRFHEVIDVAEDLDVNPELIRMATRGSCREFNVEPIPVQTLRMLAGVALSAPTKSDLQQRDLIIVTDPTLRDHLNALLEPQSWIAGAPAFVVFCGNNQRQRLLHQMRGHQFVNDHVDALFNAAVDAGVALAAFVAAAEAIGLGCCPISTIRNDADKVSDLLELPDYVFPVAALAVGLPKRPPRISPRIPLSVTCHENAYRSENLEAQIAEYDAYRAEVQPYASQRRAEDLGLAKNYTWSEDKARQYSLPERADFGEFLRRKGFRLD